VTSLAFAERPQTEVWRQRVGLCVRQRTHPGSRKDRRSYRRDVQPAKGRLAEPACSLRGFESLRGVGPTSSPVNTTRDH